MTTARLPWIGDTLLDYGHVQVELCIPPELYTRQSEGTRFILGKSRSMIESLLEALGERPARTIVDVGIYKGGSVVLFNEAFQPDRLVAIDLNPSKPVALIDYCRGPVAQAVRLHVGINQSDFVALDEICRADFGDRPIDLVVDDASHFYAETRATFCALFPRVRPGGLYVIEDWGWAHWPGDYWQKDRGGDYFRDKPPLSNLLIELALLCASAPDKVRRVAFNETVIYVERGHGEIPPAFALREHYFNRGEVVPLLGDPAAGRKTVFEGTTFTIRAR